MQRESQSAMFEAPVLGRLRKAEVSEAKRMALVATAAYFSSPVWQYQRPHYAEFPGDTLTSFENLLGREIRNPDRIVLVIDDAFENDEHEMVYDALKSIYPPMENAKSVIVGVAILSLPKGSNRSGQFQPESKYY